MSVTAGAGRRRSTGGHHGDVRRYAVAWALAGVVAAVVVALAGPLTALVTTVAVVLAVTVVTEFVEVRVTLDRTDSSFTLGESSIAAAILLLPPAPAILTVLAGLAVVQLVRRRGLLKSAFNLGQVAVAMSVALGLVAVIPGDDVVVAHAGTLTVVGVGMLAYGLVNVAAMAGLLHRLSGRPWRVGAREHGGRLLASVLGNTAIGMLIAALWQTEPILLALLAAPAAAMHLSSRGSLRSLVLVDEIQTERDRLERVVAGASDGIVLLDADGRVELWSPAMAELTGVPSDAVVGLPPGTALAGADAALLAAGGRDGHHTAEGPITRPDGTVREAHATHSRLIGADGLPDGEVVIVRDITREREVETMKHDFVARVSHELRTPLTPIRGMAQMLLRHRDRMDEARTEQALTLIAERSEHMGRLVEDLLLVSRITASDDGEDAEPSDASVDVGALVEQAVAGTAEQHPDRRFAVIGTAPAASADAARATRILSNLLSNACTYSPAGSPVDVILSATGDQVAVSVADRGAGIPDDKKDVVFERFQRLEDPMTMRTGGAGLGLFIARQLATAMGGSVEVVDRPDGGSLFTLTLPRADAPATVSASAASPVRRAEPARAPSTAAAGGPAAR